MHTANRDDPDAARSARRRALTRRSRHRLSSLGHLKRLPVAEIKIDRSFVAQMATNPDDAAIVIMMIQLAGQLGKRVVAEGVENEATWQMLAAAGCHLIQGYGLSRPMPGK